MSSSGKRRGRAKRGGGKGGVGSGSKHQSSGIKKSLEKKWDYDFCISRGPNDTTSWMLYLQDQKAKLVACFHYIHAHTLRREDSLAVLVNQSDVLGLHWNKTLLARLD